MVAADNKLYLYLDPIRFLGQVPFIFSPQTWLGTVTFQHIGYLMPYGPYYALTYLIKIPTWIAQRILTATLLFSAGAGIYYLSRTLNLAKDAQLVASLSYMLSPYSLQYLNRISDILLPFCALGWLLGFAIKATMSNSFRYPALFALVVAIIGGTNGSSLLFVLIAPVLWLIYSWIKLHEIDFKKFLKTLLLFGFFSLLVSIWWMLAYLIDLRYGLNILKFTETVQATTSTSSASEVLRGLGYWFYYGTSGAGPWAISSVGYEEHLWLILISFLLPSLSLLSAALIKWQHKGFFILLMTIGVVISVSAYPFNSPSLLGDLFKIFMLKTTFGYALRSADRATPLVVASTSILLATGVHSFLKYLSLKKTNFNKYKSWALTAVMTIIVLNYPSLYNQQLLTPQYVRPSNLPNYYYQAADYLNHHSNNSRILVEPGDVSSVFSWGVTTDPILPALTKRPIVQRDQVVGGTAASLDLITSLDNQFQNDTIDPNTIAPIARLMSVGDLVIQSDLAYWIYDLPDPRQVYAELTPTPNGLSKPTSFGKPVANLPPKNQKIYIGEQVLPKSSRLLWPAPLMVYPVDNPRPIYRTESTLNPVILDGSADGLIEASGANLLANNPTIFYYGSLAKKSESKILQLLLSEHPQLILTDSNAKEAHRWGGSILNTTGEIETASQRFNPADYGNQPLILFPTKNGSSETVTIYEGIKQVEASAYGNQVNYMVGQRPYLAIDGNPSTAWEFSLQAYSPPQWWQVTFLTPITIGKIALSQDLPDQSQVYITKVTLTFDGKNPITFKLNRSSLTPAGQTLTFKPQTFTTLRITIDSVKYREHTHTGTYNVGFSTVNIGGIQAGYLVRTPIDMLSNLSSASMNDRLTILLSRRREGGPLGEPQPELYLSREIYLPVSRTFSISGEVNLSNLASDQTIDEILGRSDNFANAFVARSSGHTPGYLTTIASQAFDGSPQDAWEPGSGEDNQIGAWIELDAAHLISFNNISFRVLNDKLHSVPTKIQLSTEQGTRILNLPKIPVGKNLGSTYKVSFRFPAMAGRHIRLTILAIKARFQRAGIDQPYFALPIGISDIKLPGVKMPKYPKEIPQKCYDDLLYLNGVPLPNNQSTGIPIPIKLIGSTKNALDGKEIKFVGCGSSSNGVTLNEGYNTITSNPGSVTGISIDNLYLDSAAGGRPEPLTTNHTLVAEKSSNNKNKLKILKNSSTYSSVIISHDMKPFWFILGESFNNGFKIKATNAVVSRDQLIDGFANGWLLKPTSPEPIRITLYFYPQVYLNWSLIFSAIVFLLLLAIAIFNKNKVKAPFKNTKSIEINLSVFPNLKPFINPSIKSAKTAFSIGIFSGLLGIILCNYSLGVILFSSSFLISFTKLKYPLFKYGSFLLGVSNAILITIFQAINDYPANGGWPSSFFFANTLAWAAIIILILFVMFEKRLLD